MRWRLAKKLIQLDGKDTCRCGEAGQTHRPPCRGRGRLRRWSAYHRIAPPQWGRWWRAKEAEQRRNDALERIATADEEDCRDLMLDMDGGPIAEWEHGGSPTGHQSRGRAA